MMLYSYKGSLPAPLPFRITLPNGFTRTDPTTFTAEEIALAGYTGPYTEPPYNPDTQVLDWVNETYVVRDLPPPAPTPDWFEFSTSLMSNSLINTMLSSILSVAPGLYGGLTVGLNEASKGDARLFTSAWANARKEGLVSEEVISLITTLSLRCNLPASFITEIARPFALTLGQQWTDQDGLRWEVVRSRNSLGQFLPDDPQTPEKESLEWELIG